MSGSETAEDPAVDSPVESPVNTFTFVTGRTSDIDDDSPMYSSSSSTNSSPTRLRIVPGRLTPQHNPNVKKMPRRSQSAFGNVFMLQAARNANQKDDESESNIKEEDSQDGEQDSDKKPHLPKRGSVAALRDRFNSVTSLNSDSDSSRRSSVEDNGHMFSRRGTMMGKKGIVSKFRGKFLKKAKDLTTPKSDAQRHEEAEASVGEKTGGKVVIYTTSVSTVRETYSNSQAMRQLFQTHRVPFEERDVSLSRDFALQLAQRAPGHQPPICFFNGKMLGDFDTVQKLNESDELGKMIAKMPKIETGTSGECGQCGGRGFIPCSWCGGDRKSMTSRFGKEVVKLRCTCCNENGLMRCTACYVPIDAEMDV